MSIHEDVQQGTLPKDTRTRNRRDNSNILHEQDCTCRAPPAIAAVAGLEDETKLPNEGATADALSRDGKTALLLITCPKASRNWPKVVHLILSKRLAESIDATIAADGKNTPLMFAVLNEDLEFIRLLLNAGASLAETNERSPMAKETAMATTKAVARALGPQNDCAFARLTAIVVSVFLYIVAWVKKVINGVARRLFGPDPDLNEDIDDVS